MNDIFDMDWNDPSPSLIKPDDVVRGRRPGLAIPRPERPVENDGLRRRLSCRRLEGVLGAARAWKRPPGVRVAISAAPGEVTVELRARATGQSATITFTRQRSPFAVQVALRRAAVALLGQAA